MMRPQLVPAIRALAILSIVCGLVYPLALTGFAQVVFPNKANGSLIERDGSVVGSSLIGQVFTSERYFHTRPSAAGAAAVGAQGADPRDLSQVASGASNLGPTNPELARLVTERVAAYRTVNNLAPGTKVPIDAVTASGSGLDPHISVANARLQAGRVAKARGLPRSTVEDLVKRHTETRTIGFLGEPGVNVLELNLALDRAGKAN